ncbi:metallophosphoesterase family protein [Myroides profundi]|uniref:Serine/threonine protein phosphatase 1 n=1 Tax=Myroides profundi TaxID=480520 RepID=A0AAJ4W1G6_MYRPR|nr:metallophosphoesterase family protein [Myroides profundi]AJH16710.1 serine/threonine protein phosphatase 1 [Myroides profundi]SEQ10398.1 serine/threonine protein phosphatase 1 [Myroides profundi]
MSRTLVIGDIHGGYKALLQVMERAKVTPSDKLIFLGDYVDGWSESEKVVEYLLALKETHNCTFLRGNHETLLVNWLETGKENKLWEGNGGDASVKSYSLDNITKEMREKHLHFFRNLQNYYIDESNRLFVHAGFTNLRGVKDEYIEEGFYWDRTLWEMVLSMDTTISKEDIRYPKRLLHYHEIFIGHTPVTNYGFKYPMNFANVWNIDTGAAFLGRISILDIETKEYWQSDVVAELYPDEEGRNHK